MRDRTTLSPSTSQDPTSPPSSMEKPHLDFLKLVQEHGACHMGQAASRPEESKQGVSIYAFTCLSYPISVLAQHPSPNSPRRLRPTPLLLGRQDGAQLSFFLLTTFFLTLFFLRNVIAYSNWWKR